MDKIKQEVFSLLGERAEQISNLFQLGQLASKGGYYAYHIEKNAIFHGERYDEIEERLFGAKMINEPHGLGKAGFVHGPIRSDEITVYGRPILVRQFVSMILEQGSSLPFNTVVLKGGTKLNLTDPQLVYRWLGS